MIILDFYPWRKIIELYWLLTIIDSVLNASDSVKVSNPEPQRDPAEAVLHWLLEPVILII